jgi:hypothetical protein
MFGAKPMSIVVSLREFVDEMDTMGDGWLVYLNRRTGEFLSTSEEGRAAAEEEDDDDLPDWLREELPRIREAMTSEDWLGLPSKFDLDEYRIMEHFCDSLEDPVLGDDLRDTIGGRGTFGRFKNMIHRHNIHKEWYRFRDEALREIAVRWLEAHEIPYRE